MPLWCLLGHKHDNKHLIKKARFYFMTAVMLVSIVTPQSVLAFEAGLPGSPATKLVAQVQLQGHGDHRKRVMTKLPDYSYRDSGVVTAYPPVKTKKGNWQMTKLAYAVPRVMPKSGSPLVLEGEASFYSRAGCLGCSPALRMANGQPLDDSALTMAIGADKKHLVGHEAKVTNLSTGQSVNVQITDTGGFYREKYGRRVADLTVATKQAIGMAGGVGQVKVEVY